jgi:hypothetical protein
MSYSEDTTDLEMRAIMERLASALLGITIDMKLADGRLVPAQEVGP